MKGAVVLNQILMPTSVFFINNGNLSEISLKKDEWISVSNLNTEYLERIKSDNYKAVFLRRENIFSHAMNVLRKVIYKSSVVVAIGTEGLFDVLENADNCIINISDNIITINDNDYVFKDFSFSRDASEIMEYNLDTDEICYKPDYYYNEELSYIVVNGYNMARNLLPAFHSSRSDYQGRIWNKGFIFPHQFYDYYSVHTDEFYNHLRDYVFVLEKIFSLRHLNTKEEEFSYAISKHYSYSIIFSFITPIVSEKVVAVLGNDELEKVYNVFVVNSPIHSKDNLTDTSLKNMKDFLTGVIGGTPNKENYFNVYHAFDMPSHNSALMYFVANMLSDIRRCVINVTTESNNWFKAIYKHRKKPEIY